MSPVDPFVQRWIAGTNGRLYEPLIGNLRRYPVPIWRGPKPKTQGAILLDIGCGWGRWMVSSAAAGYVPIGIDLKLEPLEAARRVMRAHQRVGYIVAADLKRLPFKPYTFDLVFSYSVLQHTHKSRARACIDDTHRVLRSRGLCMLQFPLSDGIGYKFRRLAKRPDRNEEGDYASWCVRYYSLTELEAIFRSIFADFRFTPDCHLGIGIQRTDFNILPLKFKPIVILSEALKELALIIRPLARHADAVYIMCQKQDDPTVAHHSPVRYVRDGSRDNLAVLQFLQCPITGSDLELSADCTELISRQAGVAYPVVNDIPIMIPEQSRKL